MADKRERETDPQKHKWRLLLDEAWRGIVGNTAYDIVKSILLVLSVAVGSWLVSLGQRALAAAVPALRDALSTQIVVTVGTITAIAIPVLILSAIWLFSARKRWLKGREKEQAVAELSQRISEFERHKKDLLEIQRADHDRLNQQTTKISELQSRLREQTVFKAIYYDPDYMESWIKNPEAIAKFFDDRGFEVVNAQQLGYWVQERRKRNESCRSILVFAQDVVPDTVADLPSPSDTCELRLFLNEGGRVVWHGDVPFWYRGHPRRKHQEWGVAGQVLVLRVGLISFSRPFRSILTEKGRMWGMTLPDPAERAVPTEDVDDVFTFLPYKAETGAACSWRKVYNPRFPHSGFLRYWPSYPREGRDASVNAEYFRFATSCCNPIPEVELPEIEIPRTQVFVSGNEADKFRRANTDDPWQLAKIEHRYWSWIEIPGAQWIWWEHWVTPEFRTGGAVEHRRDFELDGKPQQTTLMIAVDDRIKNLQINGVSLGDDVGNWHEVTIVDLTPHVHQGTNRLEMIVVNVDAPPTDENPTGLCYRIDVIY